MIEGAKDIPFALADPRVVEALRSYRVSSVRMQELAKRAQAIETEHLKPVGDGRRATGDGRRATGDGRRATGDGRRATGDGRRATGDDGGDFDDHDVAEAFRSDTRLRELEHEAEAARAEINAAAQRIDSLVGNATGRALRTSQDTRIDAAIAAHEEAKAMKNRLFKCEVCGKDDFERPQALGAHKRYVHGKGSENGASKVEEAPAPAEASSSTDDDDDAAEAPQESEAESEEVVEDHGIEALKQCVAWIETLDPGMRRATASYLNARYVG